MGKAGEGKKRMLEWEMLVHIPDWTTNVGTLVTLVRVWAWERGSATTEVAAVALAAVLVVS